MSCFSVMKKKYVSIEHSSKSVLVFLCNNFILNLKTPWLNLHYESLDLKSLHNYYNMKTCYVPLTLKSNCSFDQCPFNKM